MSPIDPRALRSAFGSFMTGVTVVTTRTPEGQPLGFTANSFSSVSLDPPLLLVCPGKFLSSCQAFARCRHFAINVLAEGQEEVSNTFAGYKGDRFARVPHQDDSHGTPLIDGAIAQFSCTTHRVIEAGDHYVLIGAVEGFSHSAGDAGLGYVDGRYFSLGLERAALENVSQTTVCGAIIECDGKVLLDQTAQGYRLPETRLTDWSSLRVSLAQALSARGITAQIGAAYSVFDDPAGGVHHTYFLASARAPGRLQPVPYADLAALPYASAVTAQMMTRFAQEARNRSFSLYLGGPQSGDVHALPERS